jgi:acetoacetyl-CoA reductase
VKTLLISGGTGGIGSALSIKFIEKGYKVFTTHNNKSEDFLSNWLIQNNIPKKNIQFINCDIRDEKNTKIALEQVLKNNNIDVLINNAGITKDSSFLKMTSEQWSDVINTNLISIFNFTQSVAKQMADRKFGNIINISSINALKGQFGQTNYSASKSGIIGFTKSLALELSSKGVRVNAICPGYTLTPMVQKLSPEILKSITSNIPIGKLVNANEIANTALFIVEDMPSLTGETISVNGGHYMS